MGHSQHQMRLKQASGSFFIALALFSLTAGCIAPSGEPYQRTSLFGSRRSAPARGLPPASATQNEATPPIATGEECKSSKMLPPQVRSYPKSTHHYQAIQATVASLVP